MKKVQKQQHGSGYKGYIMPMSKIILPERRGWVVRIDGETLDTLKQIQEMQDVKPSYSAIIAKAVRELQLSILRRELKDAK